MARLQRKPKGSYHHPDLESALVDAAVRTIREEGVEALTLRGVGARLGVSRTALYRHFKDKSALLARVALDGFRRFRAALQSAVERAHAGGLDPIEEMGPAYVGFALANESHYLTMFGGVVEDWEHYPDLVAEAEAAFSVLHEVILDEQRSGRIQEFDAELLAEVVWAGVHGQAMLVLTGHLDREAFEDRSRLNWRLMREGVSAKAGAKRSRAPKS